MDTLPTPSLLCDYALVCPEIEAAAYRDAFELQVGETIGLEQLIIAFYTSWLFRLERRILAIFMNAPSSDDHVQELAAGQRDHFAAWSVAERSENEILLCDTTGATRSWLCTSAEAGGNTCLRFGSVVVASKRIYRNPLILGAHRLYSRALLRAAVGNLGAGDRSR